MKWRYNRKLIPRAKEMRHEDMTPAEKKLWFEYLKGKKPRWRDQRPFDGYIVDFYCPALKLVIEVDGDSHFTPEAQAYDAERTKHLESLGLHIIRFSNLEIMQNFAGVCEQLEHEILRPKFN